MFIHLNIFSWLTFPLGKLVSQHDSVRAKWCGSSEEHCFLFHLLRVKQGHVEVRFGQGGEGGDVVLGVLALACPVPSLAQAAEVRGLLLIPRVPAHGAGAAGMQRAGRQSACCRRVLFKVSAVAVLCSSVLFVKVFLTFTLATLVCGCFSCLFHGTKMQSNGGVKEVHLHFALNPLFCSCTWRWRIAARR